VLARAAQLPEAELLQLYEHLGVALAGQPIGEPRRDRRLRERTHALRTLAAVRAHLELADGERLTAGQFTASCRVLDNDWNHSRVIRAWGTWRNATDVLAGAEPVRRAEQEAVKLALGFRRSSRRPALDGLLEWLKTKPRGKGIHRYDAWARDTNAALAPHETPYLTGSGTAGAMRMGFTEARRYAEAILAGTEPAPIEQPAVTDHALLTFPAFAAKLGLSESGLRGRAERDGRPLPPAVLQHDQRLYWSADDGERWISGETTTRDEFELDATVLDRRRLAQQLGLSRDTVRERYALSPHRLPAPAGQLDGRPWWDPREVEQWQAADHTTGQKRQYHGPGTITIGDHHLLAVLPASELLGISPKRFLDLRSQGHLPPAMIFATRPLWPQEDLAAYQAGREIQRTEGELNGLILSTAHIAARLGVRSGAVMIGLARASDRYPPPDGALGTRPWWNPQRFEEWLTEHQEPLQTADQDQDQGRDQGRAALSGDKNK